MVAVPLVKKEDLSGKSLLARLKYVVSWVGLDLKTTYDFFPPFSLALFFILVERLKRFDCKSDHAPLFHRLFL